MTEAQTAVTAAQRPASLVSKLAEKYNVEPNKMLDSLKATAFHSDKDISNEQMMALLVVADQYGLNPWTRELYAFPDSKRGGIVPIVSIDGWTRIINERPELTGIEFDYGPDDDKRKGAPQWIECTIHRRDRQTPTRIRERLVECYRETGPWQSHPGRMLRHKALIQAARVAFGFGGIYDPDEGERIVYDGTATRITDVSPAISDINNQVRPPAHVIEYSPGGAVPSMTLDANGQGEVVKADGAQDKATSAPKAVKESRFSKSSASPTYVDVRGQLDRAKTPDAIDLAESLVDSLPDQFHVELHELAKQRRVELSSSDVAN